MYASKNPNSDKRVLENPDSGLTNLGISERRCKDERN